MEILKDKPEAEKQPTKEEVIAFYKEKCELLQPQVEYLELLARFEEAKVRKIYAVSTLMQYKADQDAANKDNQETKAE